MPHITRSAPPYTAKDLLSSSSDLLKEFALRRAGRERPSEEDREAGVAVREDMLLEVRLGDESWPGRGSVWVTNRGQGEGSSE